MAKTAEYLTIRVFESTIDGRAPWHATRPHLSRPWYENGQTREEAIGRVLLRSLHLLWGGNRQKVRVEIFWKSGDIETIDENGSHYQFE